MSINIIFEHQFWLRILRDHLTFIGDKLANEYTDEINMANTLKREAIEKLLRVETGYNVAIEDVIDLVKRIRQFKVHLLDRHVEEGEFKFGLPPTFINHMINELDQYLRILQTFLKDGIVMRSPELNAHELWLLDATGHVSAIMAELDPVEKDMKKRLKKQGKGLNNLLYKTKEFIDYVVRLNDTPDAVERLNKLVINEITAFDRLLTEIYNLRLEKELLGTFSQLLIDHMLREEAYYLMSLGLNVGNRAIVDMIVKETQRKD